MSRIQRLRHLAEVERPMGAGGVVAVVFLGFLPAALVLLYIEWSIRHGLFALDFHNSSWPAGRAVLNGNFDYSVLFARPDPFIYPPLTAVLLVPLAALPIWVADGVYTGGAILAVILAMRAFGVKDWRCYGCAFLWPPVLSAVEAGNFSLLLVGGLGLIWALRTRIVVLGLAVAILITAKLVLAPVVLWLLLTRRFRAAIWTAFFFVTLNVLSWIAIGAGSFRTYLSLLQEHTHQQEWDTYTLKVIAAEAGLPRAAGMAVTALAVAALLAVWWKWWRGNDRATFAVIVLVALVASPIVWLHYLALLIVPLALMRRSLSWVWFLPLVTVFCPGKANGTLAQTALGVALIAAVALVTLWPPGARLSYAVDAPSAQPAR